MEASATLDVVRPPAVIVARLTARDIMDMWAFIGPLVESACDHSGNRFTARGCVERVHSGVWTCWVAAQGGEARIVAFVSESEYPDTGKRVMAVEMLGGAVNRNNEDIIAACNKRLVEYARERGVDEAISDARNGWLRKFPRAFEGADQIGVILSWGL